MRRQHLGEYLHRASELLLGHRSDCRRSDLKSQRMPRVEGSESDPWSLARCGQGSPVRRVTFHIYIIHI
jgi:hypothetical protein